MDIDRYLLVVAPENFHPSFLGEHDRTNKSSQALNVLVGLI